MEKISTDHSAIADVAKPVEETPVLFYQLLTWSSMLSFAFYLSSIILNVNFHRTLKTLGSVPSLRPQEKQYADSASRLACVIDTHFFYKHA